MDQALLLSDRILQNLGTGKVSNALQLSIIDLQVFKDHSKGVNSMDFTVDGMAYVVLFTIPTLGRFLVSASDDDSVAIYDCEQGTRSKLLFARKYGVENLNFVHSGNYSAICSSRNDFDFSLRYWDLYENKYIRFFKGHVGAVTSVDVHPYEDLFLSSSVDRTSLLWDLRKEKPVGRIHSRSPGCSAFDNQGLVFAVCAGDSKVHLYDSRNFEKGEFTFFNFNFNLNKIKFSPCGKYLLVTTDTGKMYTVDSFKGTIVSTYRDTGIDCVPSFSPDSQYVTAGSPSGAVNIYKTLGHAAGDGEEPVSLAIARHEGHSAMPRVTLFNPVRCMIASACVNVALWIPKQ
jgi:COMPASS component SWD2